MWKTLRISLLLLILAVVAGQQLIERTATQSWKSTLWVGVFPIAADDTDSTQRYVARLAPQDFRDIETFFAREAQRYGVALETPVHIELYPPVHARPPELPPDPGVLSIAWWSLKLRAFAFRHSSAAGHPPSRIRIFVLYHDPAALDHVPDSHGLQKGLVGVVHAYADETFTGSNNMVIAHELLHTVGASDKYDLGSGAPLYPLGYADPGQRPLYPQARTEIMAGRYALSATEFEIPRSLRTVVVGPATALEIRWTHP